MELKLNDMKIIIPAKTNSNRVPNKNWREFHNGKSLVEVTVDKLIKAGVMAYDIYISCDDEIHHNKVHDWGCKFDLLPEVKTENGVNFRDWLGWTCNHIAPGETVGWAQVTSPLFNEYKSMLAEWNNVEQYLADSMVAVYPVRQYLLDPAKAPVGWQFGDWHTPSQNLPDYYMMPWAFSILTPEAIERTGYHIGSRPTWWQCPGQFLDIDTEEDFEYAQWKYSKLQSN